MTRLLRPGAWTRGSGILIFGLVAFVVVLAACGHGAKACAVVDVAHESCKVVRYLAPDGTVEELSPQDLADVAAAKRTARARAAGGHP